MNHTLIFKNIQKHIILDRQDKVTLQSVFVPKVAAKGELLIQQGGPCRKIYFVESGSLRAYHVNEEGKESTIMFSIQDWWITDMYAFVNKKDALLSIVAMETSKLISFDCLILDKLYIKLPKLERFFRILFQNAYIREQLRNLDNISLSTSERYHRFITKYPQIIKHITQKQIASYLGVTPEFLSSIKKKTSTLKLS